MLLVKTLHGRFSENTLIEQAEQGVDQILVLFFQIFIRDVVPTYFPNHIGVEKQERWLSSDVD